LDRADECGKSTGTDEVAKEQATVRGHQMEGTRFVHKDCYAFCFASKIRLQ
jgi:hypothetical protein